MRPIESPSPSASASDAWSKMLPICPSATRYCPMKNSSKPKDMTTPAEIAVKTSARLMTKPMSSNLWRRMAYVVPTGIASNVNGKKDHTTL